MAISKRLRYEILRRDNHACRYCGQSAPEVKLHVDHVVPKSLGGADEPSNLVTACQDCNAGKSSTPADAAIVEDVAQDALRWSKAMQIVAESRATERALMSQRREEFLRHWNGWKYTYMGQEKTVDLPNNWGSSIDQFLASGLEMDDLFELVDVAMRSKSRDEWKYFCGCCWRRIYQSQEHARNIVSGREENADG